MHVTEFDLCQEGGRDGRASQRFRDLCLQLVGPYLGLIISLLHQLGVMVHAGVALVPLATQRTVQLVGQWGAQGGRSYQPTSASGMVCGVILPLAAALRALAKAPLMVLA